MSTQMFKTDYPTVCAVALSKTGLEKFTVSVVDFPAWLERRLPEFNLFLR